MDIHDGKWERLDLVGRDMIGCRSRGLASEGGDIGTIDVYSPIRVVYGYGTVLQLIFSYHFDKCSVGRTSHEFVDPPSQIGVGELPSGIDGLVIFHRGYEGVTRCGDLLFPRRESGVIIVKSGATLHKLHGTAIVLVNDDGCFRLGIHCDPTYLSYRGQGQNIC